MDRYLPQCLGKWPHGLGTVIRGASWIGTQSHPHRLGK
jgi:hypothetical protein